MMSISWGVPLLNLSRADVWQMNECGPNTLLVRDICVVTNSLVFTGRWVKKVTFIADVLGAESSKTKVEVLGKQLFTWKCP